MLRRMRMWIVTLVLCCAPVVVLAQVDCVGLVEQALAAVDQLCQDTGRNQACYGNIAIDAQSQPDAPADFRFQTVGDLASINDIQSLRLSAMQETESIWGVALLRLQANIPNTLPGQNVTFLLFGDVEIQDMSTSDQAPMSAIMLRTGVEDARCEEAPESGLLVQTPDGVSEVAFNINGVDVSMGSTVLFQGNEANGMTVSTLEGAALIGAEDDVQFVLPGSWSRVAMGDGMRAMAAPELPTSYERRARMMQALPTRVLQRRIQAAPPMTPDQIALFQQRMRDGLLPCDVEGLPDCEQLRRFVETRLAMCAALRPNERPRFCRRLRRFVERVQQNNDAANPLPTTAPVVVEPIQPTAAPPVEQPPPPADPPPADPPPTDDDGDDGDGEDD
jgi:hypothetical protein